MAGRVLSGKNETKLREAMQSIMDVLAQLGLDEADSERALRGLSAAFEQRSVPIEAVEVRGEDGGAPVISGYAAVFNRLSQPLMNFREQIAPGAFRDGLASGDIRALWQHDTARVLGRTKNGTLKVWEDARGLAFELTPPDTQDGRDALALIARGDVDQMSFGFTVPQGGDEWAEDKGGEPIRTLRAVNLIEVSPVTFPAYLDTSAGVLRNAPEWVQRALHLQGDVSDTIAADQARARLEAIKRRLELAKRGGK